MRRFFVTVLSLMFIGSTSSLVRAAQERSTTADVPSEQVRIGDNEKKEYYLAGKPLDRNPPATGHPLLIIIPGPTGCELPLGFSKRIIKNALPADYLVAQPIPVTWTNVQKVGWPTKHFVADKMEFTTEQFVADIIKDVKSKHKIDAKRVFTLSWGLAAPAGLQIGLENQEVTGTFVTMPHFNLDLLDPLTSSKGKAFYVYHAKDDRASKISSVEKGVAELTAHGAKVEFVKFDGKSGWGKDTFGDIRKGVEWLEKNHSETTPVAVRRNTCRVINRTNTTEPVTALPTATQPPASARTATKPAVPAAPEKKSETPCRRAQ